MSNLLGGNSKQSSNNTSSNQAFPTLQGALGSTISQTGDVSSLLGQLLTGTGGDAAYNSYKNSSGFQNQLQAGSQAITDNAASRGLLQSGATGKALAGYGTDLANQNFNNYLSQLTGLGNMGIQAAGTLASAGQTSTATSKGKSKTGLGL